MEDQSTSAVETVRGRPLRAVLVAFGLTLFGILTAELFTLPAFLYEPMLIDEPGQTSLGVRTAFFVLNFVGMAAAGAIYLAYTNRGWDYVDLSVPDKRGWVYALGGTVAVIAFYVLTNIVVTLLDAPVASSGITEYIGGDEAMILILIAIAFLFNSPAEEFLFRNVIQKRLYDAFDRTTAVVVASAIFSLVHFPVYALLAESTVAVVIPLIVLFFGGLVMGYAYVVTENLVVPIIIHAVYNAFNWALLYVAMIYGFEEGEEMAGAVVDVLVVLG
ncbi:CPBP family intramembrane metalloprotease [Halobacteria archaeon AArc-dxtr1]|nr:CPBP family intramembrane metalloprotease [Halobacteria archaeon AArc-dxtr1]